MFWLTTSVPQKFILAYCGNIKIGGIQFIILRVEVFCIQEVEISESNPFQSLGLFTPNPNIKNNDILHQCSGDLIN